MISVAEVKKTMIGILKGKYGNAYKYYGIEVTEGYEKPAFFTQLVPIRLQGETKNAADSAYSFVITYFQKKIDEVDALTKLSEIREAYGLKLRIGDRYVNVDDVDYDFVGERNNILQITVGISFKEKVMKAGSTQPLMKHLMMNERMEV